MREQVECPRCSLQLNLVLHAITTTDAQQCPRCWQLDRIEIPMGIYPPGRGGLALTHPRARVYK